MNINRRLFFSFDWLCFAALAGIVVCGLVAIWSTSVGTGIERYFGRQLIYLAVAAAAFLIVLYFDYHLYSDFVSILYMLGLGVLIAVLVLGESRHGNRSWLNMGVMSFQPSELMKVVVVLALAKYYSEAEREDLELGELAFGAAIVAIPMTLVVLQGDLGTAVTFIPIYLALSFVCGLKRKHLLMIGLTMLLTAPVGWMLLKEYHKARILSVVTGASDPRSIGYQANQSKIAIGSGRFLGKGLKQGSQGQLGFLPARHTDFVFAVWCEERGFIGGIALLSLFLIVCFRLVSAAREAKDKVGALIATGVLALLLFHIAVNVGMVLGLVPIAGIPLPMVSAGGSSLLSSLIAMGICLNVKMRRYVN